MQVNFQLEVELKYERLVHQSHKLAMFRRNPSTWELLLKLAMQEHSGIDGIYHTIEQIETRYLGNSALLKFVRERRDDGLLEFREHAKRSMWTVTLEPTLREELVSVLDLRNSELLNGATNSRHSAATPMRVDRTPDSSRKTPDAHD